MKQAKCPEGEGRDPACRQPSKPCFVSFCLELCSAMWKPLLWDLSQPHPMPLPSLFSNWEAGEPGRALPPHRGEDI